MLICLLNQLNCGTFSYAVLIVYDLCTNVQHMYQNWKCSSINLLLWEGSEPFGIEDSLT